MHSPPRGLQTRMLQSSEPVTTERPSGVNDPQLTEPLWPAKTCMQVPSSAFHIQAVKSSLPASTTRPRGCQHSHSSPPPGPSSVLSSPAPGRAASLRAHASG